MSAKHEKTRNKIVNAIASDMRMLAGASSKFREESRRLSADGMMSQAYKEQKISEARSEYYAAHEKYKQYIIESLNEILAFELEAEQVFDFDAPDFGNTMAAINTAQGKLPHEVIAGIKAAFAGRYQSIRAIAAALERHGVNVEQHGYTEFLQSAGLVLPDIIALAENLDQSEYGVLSGMSTIYKKLIRFGESRGAAFTDEEKTIKLFDDDSRDHMARVSMGLPV